MNIRYRYLCLDDFGAIIFYLHQDLSCAHPCPNGVLLKTMKSCNSGIVHFTFIWTRWNIQINLFRSDTTRFINARAKNVTIYGIFVRTENMLNRWNERFITWDRAFKTRQKACDFRAKNWQKNKNVFLSLTNSIYGKLIFISCNHWLKCFFWFLSTTSYIDRLQSFLVFNDIDLYAIKMKQLLWFCKYVRESKYAIIIVSVCTNYALISTRNQPYAKYADIWMKKKIKNRAIIKIC